ncbi:MAG: hypothetical protein IJ639_07105 [Ruminococcus sp.]|nr:hypothetical protein [Ruminococcus sp.]
MKRIVTLLIAAAMIATVLTACSGSSEEKVTKEESSTTQAVAEGNSENTVADTVGADYVSPYRPECDKAVAYVNSLMNTAGMTESDDEKEDSEESTHMWRYDTETENSDFPLDVTVLEQKISIGTTTVKDLRESGLTLEADEETVEPQGKVDIDIRGESGGKIRVCAKNFTDKAENIDNLQITEIHSNDGETGLTYTYNGVSEGDDLKAILDAFGTPNDYAAVNAWEYGTMVYLNYKRDEGNTHDSMGFILQYDAEKNVATLLNFGIERNVD